MLGRLVAITALAFASLTSQAADHAHREAPLSADMSKHYTVLSEPQAVPANGKIHVEEVFWYGCGHCFALEEFVKSWQKKLAADVEFNQVPAMFGKTWVVHAQMFYVAQALGVKDKLHGDVFNEIHLNKKRLLKKDEQRAFFADYGVSAEDFDKAYNSFTVKSRLKQTDKRVRGFKISGVPAVVVNGKYVVDAGSAGGAGNIFKVVNYLIEQERHQ